MPTTELDVRTIPSEARNAEVLRVFDLLAVGDAVLLTDQCYPRALLTAMLSSRPRRFDWNVLEAGPATWRVELRARASTDDRTVSECLTTDHQRLDAMLVGVKGMARAGDMDGARKGMKAFRTGLERHIEMEESVLFPTFEDLSGMTQGPTRVMRAEHVTIRGCLDAMTSALADSDADGFFRVAQDLAEVLEAHNMKEEGMLYPMSDEYAGGPAERDGIVRRMQLL